MQLGIVKSWLVKETYGSLSSNSIVLLVCELELFNIAISLGIDSIVHTACNEGFSQPVAQTSPISGNEFHTEPIRLNIAISAQTIQFFLGFLTAAIVASVIITAGLDDVVTKNVKSFHSMGTLYEQIVPLSAVGNHEYMNTAQRRLFTSRRPRIF